MNVTDDSTRWRRKRPELRSRTRRPQVWQTAESVCESTGFLGSVPPIVHHADGTGYACFSRDATSTAGTSARARCFPAAAISRGSVGRGPCTLGPSSSP